MHRQCTCAHVIVMRRRVMTYFMCVMPVTQNTARTWHLSHVNLKAWLHITLICDLHKNNCHVTLIDLSCGSRYRHEALMTLYRGVFHPNSCNFYRSLIEEESTATVSAFNVNQCISCESVQTLPSDPITMLYTRVNPKVFDRARFLVYLN